jgi:pimeloyl-ACP methyl ester carboxylesterase
MRLVENLRNLDRNRAEAQRIAAKILLYQERYPGRPVHLIGYSGGGGVAVLALEALPPGQKITGAILLAPTLAFDYNLQPAMSHTERGLLNFYSPLDALVLMALGTAAGTTDGRHTFSAGAIGFQVPKSLDAARREAYQRRLFQQEYQLDMLWDGHPGGHFGWANPSFVAKRVAPLVDVSPDPPLQIADRNGDRRTR